MRLKDLVAYAKSKGVSVETSTLTGYRYDAWRNDDHSTVACSKNLVELRFDIDDLASNGRE